QGGANAGPPAAEDPPAFGVAAQGRADAGGARGSPARPDGGNRPRRARPGDAIGPPRRAGGPPPGCDRPSAWRRDRADAAPLHHQGGSAAPAGRRGEVDPGRLSGRGARRRRQGPTGRSATRGSLGPAPILAVMERLLRRSTGMSTAAVATATGMVDEARIAFEALYRSSRDDVYAYVAGLLRDRSA